MAQKYLTMPPQTHTTLIGSGIVGLATATALLERNPGLKLTVLEKEPTPAHHQTGRNSGVIHSGIYYKPGSFKARFCQKGRQSMVAFCERHGIHHEVCGKLIVATHPSELPLLENLFQRGLQHGLQVTRLSADEARSVEPHVNALAALRVPETGIVDYKEVSAKLAELIRSAGGQLLFGHEVTKIEPLSKNSGYRITSSCGDFDTRFLINCAGLHSDRIARLAGAQPRARIVPFRGEYYELTPEKRALVRALIYPVPNPDFPFLGVHFTRMVNGEVHAGPNAVLALKREGYGWRDFSARDLAETLGFPGFWRLAARNWREGGKEIWRSLSRRAFVASLQRLVPEVTEADVVRSGAGVRAQALLPNGQLVDDFLIEEAPNAIHVLNAPSPAATCALEIGSWIADKIGTRII